MREILYRGKRVDNGEFVYGYYIEATYHWHEKGIHKDWIVCGASQNGGWFTIQNRYAVIPETIGQYTGLTDKNGKKIFEGDIVKATIAYNNRLQDKVDHRTKTYEVKYHINYCYFYLAMEQNNLLFDGNWQYFLKEIEVIGNIHDNPELLGGE